MAVTTHADAVFKKGDSSPEIAKIQAALKDLGLFDEKCTGYFGDVTKAAVMKFQEQHGLTPDGILGPVTLNKLNTLTNSSITIPSRSAARKDTSTVNVRYKIKKGDTIWDIAADYNVSVESILEYNGLKEDSILQIGDEIIIPNVVKVVKPTPAQPAEEKPAESAKEETPVQDSTELNNIYEYNQDIYVVKEGDTLESIAEDFGVTVEEILEENGFSSDVELTVGQEIKIPEGITEDVEEEPEKEPSDADTKGEYLDWFKEVQYIYEKGDIATVTDVETGKSFKVKRLYGKNHADSEPLTAEDTKIMKELYGGKWSWNRRAIILTIEHNGVERKIAASMNGMPHGGKSIKNNNFGGHFCIHFKNSRTHSGSRLDKDHQNAVKKAAGLL